MLNYSVAELRNNNIESLKTQQYYLIPINPQTRQYTTRHKKSVMPSLSRLARGGLGLEPQSISKNAPRLLRVHRF